MRRLSLYLSILGCSFSLILMTRPLLADPVGAPQLFSSDVRLTYSGADGEVQSKANLPDVAFDSEADQYITVYEKTSAGGESEIFGQRISAQDGLTHGEFRISRMGPDGNTSFAPYSPRIVYNQNLGHSLVIWHGTTDSGVASDAYEVWGQLVGHAGEPLGSALRISDMGAVTSAIRAILARVAFDPVNNRYLVTWMSNTESGILVTSDYEIWGALVGYDGDGNLAPVGSQFRITTMGGAGAAAYGAGGQDLVFNAANSTFFVVWHGESNTDGHVANEWEIYGQSILPDGTLSGPVLPLSQHGTNDDARYSAGYPSIAFNTSSNELLLAWQAVDPSQPVGKSEIWARRLDASTGTPLQDQFRISQTPPLDLPATDASSAVVAYDALDNRYLAVWLADQVGDGLLDEKYEVWGRLLSADGTPAGGPIRLSHTGDDGNNNADATKPALAHNAEQQQFYTVWSGDPTTGSLLDNEREIFASTFGDLADLALVINDGQDSVPVGTEMAFTATISNAGPHQARLLTASFTLSSGLAFVSAEGSGWLCSGSGPVTCERNALAAGDSASLTLRVRGDSAGIHNVAASAANGIPDNNSANNSASDSTTAFVPTPTATPTATATPAVTETPAATATPLVSPTPTASSTPAAPSATCSLTVDRRCRGIVKKGTTCRLATAVKVAGRPRAGVAHTLERKIGHGSFRRLKRLASGTGGLKSLSLTVTRTATYRAVFGGFACTTKSIRVRVR